MAVSPLMRPLGIVAGILASVQGLAWCVLALLGILIYAEVWTPEIDDPNKISAWIFVLFLTDSTTLFMRGENMVIFMGLYLALCFVWMVLSLSHLWIAIREKWNFARVTLISWSVCTGLISILDIVAMSLFAVDYHDMKVLLDTYGSILVPFQQVSAAGVMMAVAARGFALLIANIVLAAIFAYWGLTFENQDDSRQPKREFINGYEQNRPPTWLGNVNANANGLGRPYSNPGYEPEPVRPNSMDRNHYPPISPASDNFARIGRSNLRSPPNNIPSQQQPRYQPPPRERGPYIPEPDYSPTSLRKYPKSVLKTRNHY